MTPNDNDFWMNTFEEHGSSILAFLTSRLGQRDLAEDLLQETFIRAMRGGSQLSEGGNVRSYLFTTAYHLIINQSRKKKPALFSEVSNDDGSWVNPDSPRWLEGNKDLTTARIAIALGLATN